MRKVINVIHHVKKNPKYKNNTITSLDSEKNTNTVFDMRVRGGGLPESEPDNFDCFDIGHVNGRPYRKGGSVIITLPKRLEKYKDIIEDTINQYKTAQVYPIIIFKEG